MRESAGSAGAEAEARGHKGAAARKKKKKKSSGRKGSVASSHTSSLPSKFSIVAEVRVRVCVCVRVCGWVYTQGGGGRGLEARGGFGGKLQRESGPLCLGDRTTSALLPRSTLFGDANTQAAAPLPCGAVRA